MDISIVGLRLLRAVAERGTLTAAATELGYTQSGASRQLAALERAAGARLVERGDSRAPLTRAGLALLRHARVILDEVDDAARELTAGRPEPRRVRLGVYVSAGASLLPRLLTAARRRADVVVTTREGTTPALVRAVRSGSLDLALISARPPYDPPDDELPRLVTTTLRESTLLVAAPAAGRFAGRDTVSLAELADAEWIASPSPAHEPLLGVWPALPGRARVVHSTRDWLAKLSLVAAGCGLTTVPANLAPLIPDGVRLLSVTDGPEQRRRLLAVRLPGTPSPAVAAILPLLRE
jgi:DNA-binding transcriptional LysR family regulator